GDDFIDGGAGTDTLISRGNGNFVATQTTLTGPEGVDAFVNIEAMELTGGVGNNTLDGSALTTIRARFTGGAGNDILLGGQAQDTLQGQAGNDFLSGGLGKDTLTGGNDSDTFDYRNLGDSLLSGFDVITDFNAAEDKLWVSQLPTLFTANAGSVSKLNGTQIQALLTPAILANPGDSAVFNFRNQVFVAINDGMAGYQAGSDALIKLAISGLSGSLTAGNFFTPTLP
ncbi:MAG: calcium-binding protein, partial [Cyanobacteriota bacterium]|nr:calcium-binding protein [Cyanobacteriota bacterium]